MQQQQQAQPQPQYKAKQQQQQQEPVRRTSPLAQQQPRPSLPAVRPQQIMGRTLHPVCELGRGGFGVAIKVRPINMYGARRSGSPVGRAPSPIAERAAAPNTEFLVVKFTRLASRSDPTERERSLVEAATLLRLNHPNVIKCVDVWLEDTPGYEFKGFLATAMEFCDSGDLASAIAKHFVNRDFVPTADVQRWVIDVLEGLAYVHDHHVLHRDIKPANVFLTGPNKRAILGDFGVCKQLEDTGDQAATCVGTTVYMSPEVLVGHPYDSKADMWSLGVLMYELLTGSRPFSKGRDLHNVLARANVFHAALNSDPTAALQALLAKRPDTQRLVDLACALLSVDPAARPSARAALAALDPKRASPAAAAVEDVPSRPQQHQAPPQPSALPRAGEAIPLVAHRLSPARQSPSLPPAYAAPAATPRSPVRVVPKPPSPPAASPESRLADLRRLRNEVKVHTSRVFPTASAACDMARCIGSRRALMVVECIMAVYELDGNLSSGLEAVGLFLASRVTTEPHAVCMELVRQHYKVQ